MRCSVQLSAKRNEKLDNSMEESSVLRGLTEQLHKVRAELADAKKQEGKRVHELEQVVRTWTTAAAEGEHELLLKRAEVERLTADLERSRKSRKLSVLVCHSF